MASQNDIGIPRLKRRTDRGESARNINRMVGAIEDLYGAGVPQIPLHPSQPFTHFQIVAREESGTWKGYVGKGFCAGTLATYSGNLETFSEANVTHESNQISLDIETLPWDNGIKTLIDANAGTSLTAGQFYYVYLKITAAWSAVLQDNAITSGNSNTVSVENHVASDIVTAFETTLQTTGKTTAANGEENLTRWFLLGVVDVPTDDTERLKIGQLSRDAVYLPPVYRGRELGGDLTIDASGDVQITIVSADAGNQVTAGTDNGAFVEAIVSADADNSITAGADGGAYVNLPVKGITAGTGITVTETNEIFEIKTS